MCVGTVEVLPAEALQGEVEALQGEAEALHSLRRWCTVPA
jgi:hypothetical protein